MFVQERADDGAKAVRIQSLHIVHVHANWHIQIVGDSAGVAIAADIALIYLPLIVRDGSADTVGPQND